MIGNRIEFHNGFIVVNYALLKPVDHRDGRPCSGVDKDPLGLQFLDPAPGEGDRHLFRAGKARLAHDDPDSNIFQSRPAAAGKTFNDIPFTFSHFLHVHPDMSGD